jgi:hypothetical protein
VFEKKTEEQNAAENDIDNEKSATNSYHWFCIKTSLFRSSCVP